MHLGSWSQWMLKVKGVEYIEFVGIMLRHVEPSLQWCFFLDRGTRRKIDIDGRWWKSSLGFTDFWKVKEVNDHNHHITTSPHHHITTSLHHLIPTSPHYHITTWHHYITTSPHHHTTSIQWTCDLQGSDWRSQWNCFVTVTPVRMESHETLCFLAQSGSRRRCGEPCLCDLSGLRSFGARAVAIVSSMRSWSSAFRHAITMWYARQWFAATGAEGATVCSGEELHTETHK